MLGGPLYSEAFCECHGGRQRQCVRVSDCSLRALWRAVQASLARALDAISLADLTRDERAMGEWLDPVKLDPLSDASPLKTPAGGPR